MQRKCHRCDRLFTPNSHSTWCPNCRAGKPVEPRKTKEQIELERLERIEKEFKYTRYCVQCGKNFIPTNKIEYFVVIGYAKISNEKKTTRKENKNEDTKHWVWG